MGSTLQHRSKNQAERTTMVLLRYPNISMDTSISCNDHNITVVRTFIIRGVQHTLGVQTAGPTPYSCTSSCAVIALAE
jgi:hypothetical protein